MGKPPYQDLARVDVDAARRWLDAMAWLAHAADPANGRRLDTGSRSAEAPAPGQSTRRYRNALRRIRAGMEALCEKAELALDDPSPPRSGKRCPECGRGGPRSAGFCAWDGTALEEQ